ncbi:MAG TPA: PepSY-associated TM helix domain-containing protein [Kofleriaceae bacterium]|nr:PepSY-associated TM helix domain-containing protein [Kofleriaceae bacterium]
MQWRKLFRALHRDLGYVAVSLTLAYALSGLAVNHIDDWNPSYQFAERDVDLGPLPAGSLAEQEAFVVGKLALDPRRVRGHVQDTEHELRVFLTDGEEARVDMRTGRGQLKTVSRRPVLFEVNALHLNNLKGVWTWVADLFAVALIVLAITGVTMMKGDRGILGRGKYFIAAGLAVPVGFIIYMHA